MDALLVLVTEGMVARARRKIPWLRQRSSVGISLASRYSRPKPSHMITTARWGGRCAKAGAAAKAALPARNSRREQDDFINLTRCARRSSAHRQRRATGWPP